VISQHAAVAALEIGAACGRWRTMGPATRHPGGRETSSGIEHGPLALGYPDPGLIARFGKESHPRSRAGGRAYDVRIASN
jgi:hypothetical protein